MLGKRKAVLVAATGVVSMVAVGFAQFSSGDGRTAPANDNVRRFVLILAGAADHSESTKFDLEVAAQTEALTADCMKSHGFRYTPKNPLSAVDPADASDFASLDYAHEHGFGISVFPHFLPATADKAYVKSLSGSALKAYVDSLSGCVDGAQRATEKEYGVREANSQWSQVDQKVQHDARYQSALQAWRNCASAVGRPAESRLSLIESLRKKYLPVIAEVQSGKPDVPQDQLAALAAKNPGWQSFHQAEVDAATATFPCSQATDRVYVSVFLEYVNKTR
ncbi:hypothetical protein AB0451_08740 [Streptomyces sp. NPDC052000]|uniref:hypothetical protein n=1 Tax=Streptomyces sp. NPDC052000 TaxID=3155676 RepID=UPI00344BF361